MDTKTKAAIELLKKNGYAVRLKKKKYLSALYFEIAFLFGYYSHHTKGKKTKRKILLKVTNSKRLDGVLNKFFKGKKREKFDDTADKKWTNKTVIQDLLTNGQYARYKLVERHVDKYFDAETTRIIFDKSYFPKKR